MFFSSFTCRVIFVLLLYFILTVFSDIVVQLKKKKKKKKSSPRIPHMIRRTRSQRPTVVPLINFLNFKLDIRVYQIVGSFFAYICTRSRMNVERFFWVCSKCFKSFFKEWMPHLQSYNFPFCMCIFYVSELRLCYPNVWVIFNKFLFRNLSTLSFTEGLKLF